MNFGKTYRTIREAHIGNSFSLPPTTVTKPHPQLRQFTNRTADSNRFSFGNFADDLEIYIHITECNQL